DHSPRLSASDNQEPRVVGVNSPAAFRSLLSAGLGVEARQLFIQRPLQRGPSRLRSRGWLVFTLSDEVVERDELRRLACAGLPGASRRNLLRYWLKDTVKATIPIVSANSIRFRPLSVTRVAVVEAAGHIGIRFCLGSRLRPNVPSRR